MKNCKIIIVSIILISILFTEKCVKLFKVVFLSVRGVFRKFVDACEITIQTSRNTNVKAQ